MKGYNNQININNISILSKNAINFLNSQNITIMENKIIEMNFVFKINYIIKKLDNWYGCSLSDEDSKFDGFYVEYKNRELKENDIIKTNRINIIKLPTRDSNLYFCENVIIINNYNNYNNYNNKKVIINQKDINIKTISKKESNINPGLFGNIKNENVLFNNTQNINKINNTSDLNINQTNDNNNHGITQNKIMRKKYTLISNLTIFSNNPIFLLKCKFKSEITKINSYGNETIVQNYIFYDTNGDEINGVCYNRYAISFNNIIYVDSVYEISKTERIKSNPNYNITITKSIFQLLFNKNTIIKKVEDNGEFDNVKNINENLFIQIEQLIKCKHNSIVNIIAIILEDKGITQKNKEKGEIIKYQNLIIGDNSLYKINLKLWKNKIKEDKNYSKGDIVCIYYVKYKQYCNLYELNSTSWTGIFNCNNHEKEKELKDFYLIHNDINEYIDINISLLNS